MEMVRDMDHPNWELETLFLALTKTILQEETKVCRNDIFRTIYVQKYVQFLCVFYLICLELSDTGM